MFQFPCLPSPKYQGYLALEGGPPNFPQGFPCPVVLRVSIRSLISFVYGAFTLYDGPSQGPSTKDKVCNSFGPNEVAPDTPCNTGMT